MKKIVYLLVLVVFSGLTYGQQSVAQNAEPQSTKTKFNDFISKSGQIVSFESFNQTAFSTLIGGVLSVEKRIIKRGDDQKMFLVFEHPTQYTDRSTAIAEEDLKDLFNAISTLQNDAVIDINSNSQYLEKYYETSDNFKIGYYVKNKQIKWYIDLDTRLSESTFFIKDINDFINKIKTISQ
jgi:hypothetical protein